MVETDERRRSVLRFGNGTNGRLLPAGAIVHARYQIGGGHAGNVGADQLTHIQPLTGPLSGAMVATCESVRRDRRPRPRAGRDASAATRPRPSARASCAPSRSPTT